MTEHRIRTTMRPDQVVVVDDSELLDLQRMGVVHSLAPFTLDDVPPPLPQSAADLLQEGEDDGGEEDHGEQEA